MSLQTSFDSFSSSITNLGTAVKKIADNVKDTKDNLVSHSHGDSLVFNSTDNTLTYTKTDGTTQSISLVKYLDNNTAALSGATYDAANKQLVFTREDSTTFNVDTSVFFDDTNLVNSVNGQTGAVTLTAVDVQAVATSAVGASGGVASLGSDGKVPAVQLPSLDYIPTNQKGVADGVASLDSSGKVPATQLPDTINVSGGSVDVFPVFTVTGSTIAVSGISTSFTFNATTALANTTIAKFSYSVNGGSLVDVTATNGSASANVTFTGVVGEFKTLEVYAVDSIGNKSSPESVSVELINAGVSMPTITSPADGAVNQNETVTVTSSAFSWIGISDTHASSTWQIATNSSFTSIVGQVVNSTTNKTSWTTPALTVSTTYYVRVLYTGTTNGSSSYSAPISFTTASQFNVISGVQWNPSSDTYTRTGEGTTNNAHIAVASQMKRCVLQSNGVVAYYLHPTDSTKKADGTAADLTGATGNVMVEIPKFYYKYEWTGTAHHYSIATRPAAGYVVHPAFIRSGVEVNYRYYNAYNPRDNGTKLISASGLYPTASLTRAQFRTKAAANGAGWSLVDWNLYFATQLLFIVEYANLNAQTAIGAGRTSLSGGSWANGSYYALSGLSNSKGNGTFNVSNGGSSYSTDYMTYRGIEHWFGHLWKFVDGVNVSERNYYVNNKPSTFADDVFTGDYVLKGTAGSTSGYISNFAQDGDGMFPTTVTGSSTTHAADYYYQSTGNRVVCFGGTALGGASAGPFFLAANNSASSAAADVSAGLSY